MTRPSSFLFVLLLIIPCQASLLNFFTAKKGTKHVLKESESELALQQPRRVSQYTLQRVLKKNSEDIESHAEASYQLALKLTDKKVAVQHVCLAYPHLQDKDEARRWLASQPDSVLEGVYWRIIRLVRDEPKRMRMLLEALALVITPLMLTTIIACLLFQGKIDIAMLTVELATETPIKKFSDMLYAAAKTQNNLLFRLIAPYCKAADFAELTPSFISFEAMGMMYGAIPREQVRTFIQIMWKDLVQTGYYQSMLITLEPFILHNLLEEHLTLAPDNDRIAFVNGLKEVGAKEGRGRDRAGFIHKGWIKVSVLTLLLESTGMFRDLNNVVMEYYWS